MGVKKRSAVSKIQMAHPQKGKPEAIIIPQWTDKYYPWLLLAVGFVLTAIFLNKALLPSYMLFGTDFLAGGYPSRKFLIEVLDKFHHIPLWQPYVYGGFPYIDSFASTDLFYPLSGVLRTFLPPHSVPPWLYLIHLPVALLFTYLFLREIGLGKIPSTIAGFSYMFSGQIVSLFYAGHDAKIVISCLLPGLFWLIYRGIKGKGLSRWLNYFWAGCILGCALLFSQVQMVYYSLLGIGFFWAIVLILETQKERDKGVLIKGIVGIAICFILASALAAVQFLPVYSYLRFSPRGGEGRGIEFAKSWSMPPEETIDAIIPDFSGMSVANTPYDTYWGRNTFKLHSEYVGVFPFLMSVLAILLYWKNRFTRIFLMFLILGLLFAWGAFTPIYSLLYYLPYYKNLRASGMAFFLVSFATACLTGLGTQSIVSRLKNIGEPKRSLTGNRKLVLGLGIAAGASLLLSLFISGAREGLIQFLSNQFVSETEKYQQLIANYDHFVSGTFLFALLLIIQVILLILMLRKILPKVWWSGLAIGLLIIDLWHIDFRYHQIVPGPSQYFAPDEVVSVIGKDHSLFRVFPLQYDKIGNYLSLFRIESVLGEGGNQFRRYNEFIGTNKTGSVDGHNLISEPNVLNLLNTKYIVTPFTAEDLVQRGGFILPRLRLISDGTFKVYEDLNALPRVLCVAKYDVIKNSDDILARLGQSKFNPAKEVILEEDPGLNRSTQDTSFHWSANVLRDTSSADTEFIDDPNQVKINCETSSPSLLLLLQNHYPAWKAYVDGRPAHVFRADYTFCAVSLSQGNHRVIFRYESEPYQIGKQISLLAAFILILSLITPLFVYLFTRFRKGPSS